MTRVSPTEKALKVLKDLMFSFLEFANCLLSICISEEEKVEKREKHSQIRLGRIPQFRWQ